MIGPVNWYIYTKGGGQEDYKVFTVAKSFIKCHEWHEMLMAVSKCLHVEMHNNLLILSIHL